MKLDAAAIRIALDDKDWITAAQHLVQHLGGSFERERYRVVHVEKKSIAHTQIIVYHADSGFYLYDPYMGIDYDSGWKYIEAGTIKVINGTPLLNRILPRE